MVEHLGWRWAFFINLPVGIVSLVLGSRVLPEGKPEHPGPHADMVGVALLAAGLATTAFAIVKTAEWGWGTQFVATLAVGFVLVGLFVWRCAAVRNPVLDLHLFENRNFSWANTATLVFMVGFNAMFLGNVLFLTRVWGYSILTAGLAISVGPIIVAVTAPFLGKLAGRIGQRALLVPGGIVWAVGGLWLLRTVGTQPDYAAEYLPSVALTGPRRVALPAAALVGRGAGPAGRPVRIGFRREPGGAQPRRHARCGARRRLHRRRHLAHRPGYVPRGVVAAGAVRPRHIAARRLPPDHAGRPPHRAGRRRGPREESRNPWRVGPWAPTCSPGRCRRPLTFGPPRAPPRPAARCRDRRGTGRRS